MKDLYSLLHDEWFRPISASDRIRGSLDMLLWWFRLSCWCLCLLNKASLTFSLQSYPMPPSATILSSTLSATCSKQFASISSMTDPLSIKLRSSKREWSDNVATWGFDHRFPPSSTSSSNFIHLAVSFHSSSSPSLTSSSISENRGCDSSVESSTSSPSINCTLCAGGVTEIQFSNVKIFIKKNF